MRMLGKMMLFVMLAAGVCCAADDAKPKTPKGKKPDVLTLMKPADVFISEAQDAYAEGESKQAIELYRKAMDALVAVEMEHIAWADSTEFGPLRLRKAFCETRIDGIMLNDAKTFSRTIVVTDTQDLEKKRADRLQKAESDPNEIVPVKVGTKGGSAAMMVDEESEDEAGEEADGPLQVNEELEWAKDMMLVERFEDVEQALIKVLRVDRENREARFLMSLSRVRQGKHAEALIVLDDLLEDNAMDEPTLLLAAGAYVATGAYSKAIDALDRAMKVNPKRPDACINMAWLLLEMRPNDTSEAELYYRQAVKMGASRVRDLERRLGIKQE